MDAAESLASLGVEPRLVPRLLRLPASPGINGRWYTWPEDFFTFSLLSGLPLESLLDQVEARNGG
jgi:hypothetical protein